MTLRLITAHPRTMRAFGFHPVGETNDGGYYSRPLTPREIANVSRTIAASEGQPDDEYWEDFRDVISGYPRLGTVWPEDYSANPDHTENPLRYGSNRPREIRVARTARGGHEENSLGAVVPPLGYTLVRLKYGGDIGYMAWRGAEASAPMLIHTSDPDDTWDGTGYQTADARHRIQEAVRLVAPRLWGSGMILDGLFYDELD